MNNNNIIKDAPKRRRNSRGVAIEMAVAFMLVIFALCAVITTVTLAMRERDIRVSEIANDYFVLDQVGEYFVDAVRYMGDENADEADSKANAYLVKAGIINADGTVAGDDDGDDDDDDATPEENEMDKYVVRLFVEPLEGGKYERARFTMRIWYKDKYESVYQSVRDYYSDNPGTMNEQEAEQETMKLVDPVLIVSVDRTQKSDTQVEYTITNWSDQENRRNAYLDAELNTVIKQGDERYSGIVWFLDSILLTIVRVIDRIV